MYVPKTRSDLGIPAEDGHHTIDYDEYFGDTPIYTLFVLIRQQLLAFPAYLRGCLRLPSSQGLALIYVAQFSTSPARRTTPNGPTTSTVSRSSQLQPLTYSLAADRCVSI